MSVERSLEAWEGVQRHGQDLADRLAQGFSGLLHPPSFAWPTYPNKKPFDLDLAPATADGVSAILDIGSRLGRAGADFGACVNGVVQQFFRQIPVPFGGTSPAALRADLEGRGSDEAADRHYGGRGDGREGLGLEVERFGDLGALGTPAAGGSDEFMDEDGFGLDLRDIGQFGRPQVGFIGAFLVSHH